MLRRFRSRLTVSSASLTSVPVPSGSKTSRSRTILRTWLRPFRGGTSSSTLSVNTSSPTLSLFVVAEKASTAASSAASSRLNRAAGAEVS